MRLCRCGAARTKMWLVVLVLAVGAAASASVCVYDTRYGAECAVDVDTAGAFNATFVMMADAWSAWSIYVPGAGTVFEWQVKDLPFVAVHQHKLAGPSVRRVNVTVSLSTRGRAGGRIVFGGSTELERLSGSWYTERCACADADVCWTDLGESAALRDPAGRWLYGPTPDGTLCQSESDAHTGAMVWTCARGAWFEPHARLEPDDTQTCVVSRTLDMATHCGAIANETLCDQVSGCVWTETVGEPGCAPHPRTAPIATITRSALVFLAVVAAIATQIALGYACWRTRCCHCLGERKKPHAGAPRRYVRVALQASAEESGDTRVGSSASSRTTHSYASDQALT